MAASFPDVKRSDLLPEADHHREFRNEVLQPDGQPGTDRHAADEIVAGWMAARRLDLREITLTLDSEAATLWSTMIPTNRPCFTTQVIADYISLYGSLRELFRLTGEGASAPIKYLAYKSSTPGIFSLGGDLELFARLIRTRNREGLRAYAHSCAEMTFQNYSGAGVPIVTIALIQGQALGGGLESALSCNVLVAERSAVFGLPEILFNLFPGMGAYSYLGRRVGNRLAEELILSGKTYTAEEFHRMGVIDVLAEDGEGEEAVRDYVRRNARRHNAQAAVYRTRRRVAPLTYDELRDVTDIWVDCALGLTSTDLRKMEKLVSAQDRLKKTGPIAVV